MKTKKTEWVLLAVIIVALVLYLALRPGQQPGDRLPQPAEVQSEAIDRLILTGRGDQPLELIKKDAHWTIAPQGYRADPATVRNMLRTAADLTLTALVSQSGNYERYGLTADEKTIVRAYRGDTAIRAFEVGKAAPTLQHTFVLLEGDPHVYHARGQIARTFDHTVESLRDRTVFDFNRDTVHTISLIRGREEMLLSQTPVADGHQDAEAAEAAQATGLPAPTQWQDPQGRTVDQEAATRLIDSMAHLDGDGFLEDDAADRFTEARWQLTFENPDGNYTLMVFDWPSADDTVERVDEKRPAMASTSNYAFVLDAARVERFEDAIDALFNAKAD